MAVQRPALPPAAPSGRFFSLLSLLMVAGCAGYAAFVLQTTTGPAAVQLRSTYPYAWAARPYTAADFTCLRAVLGLLAGGAAGLGGWLAASAAGRREVVALGRELVSAGRGLRAGWRALRPGQRRLAGAGLLGLTLLRGYYSVRVQPYDDATSYELFVRESLLTVSGVYALPNNHILSNTLSWGFYQLYPGFWWTMRLPVLLTSTGATAFWFLALLRRSTFRVALGAVGWCSLLSLSIYYAAAGRGYALLTGLGGVGFFALLELAGPVVAPGAGSHRLRAAWLGLVLGGVLGLYTVPTHAFFLASAYGWLALGAVRHRAGGRLLLLGAMGGSTLLGAGLLYAPVLLLSGPALLLHNAYVQPLTWGLFWRTLAETALLRHHVAALLVVVAGLGSFGRVLYLARVGRLPSRPGGWVGQLGGVSAWLFLLPYGLALLALVQPPERTFLYKAQYFFILVALLAEVAWARAPTSAARWGLRGGLAGATLLLAASQLWQLEQQERLWQQTWRWQLGAPLVDWLATQPPGAVLAPHQQLQLGQQLLRFYAHSTQGDRAWQIDETPQPGVHYRYVVLPAGVSRPREASSPGGVPAFHNALADVFVVP